MKVMFVVKSFRSYQMDYDNFGPPTVERGIIYITNQRSGHRRMPSHHVARFHACGLIQSFKCYLTITLARLRNFYGNSLAGSQNVLTVMRRKL